MSKIISSEQAIDLIHSCDTVAVGGFVGSMHPEELTLKLEEKFLKNRSPKI